MTDSGDEHTRIKATPDGRTQAPRRAPATVELPGMATRAVRLQSRGEDIPQHRDHTGGSADSTPTVRDIVPTNLRPARIRTWHAEMLVVATALATVATVRGDWREWLAAGAVLATFGHASVAERMREREALREKPDVDCHRWSWRYFVVKEILWTSYFVLTHAYAALVGCGVFLLYPMWRSWWRKHRPLKPGPT